MRVDAPTLPKYVTALPSAPYDGQEVHYAADATNGIIWHLRYRSASSSSYKWEYVGGPALSSEVSAGESTTSTTFAALATAGPSVTVPLAGDYVVAIGAKGYMSPADIQEGVMSFDIGGTGAVDADGLSITHPTTSSVKGSTSSRLRTKTAIAASTSLVAKYRTSAGTFYFESRTMYVTPRRVG